MAVSARVNHGTGATKSCQGTSQDDRSLTLYSHRQVTRRLPFSFSKIVLALLYFLVCYNLLLLACAIEGVVFEWNWAPRGVALLFGLVSIPLALLVLSSLDLHKRRKYHLSPKRIIVTASTSLVLLIVSIAILGSCYFRLTYVVDSYCPTGLREMWSIWYYYQTKADLAPTLPFLASFNMIFYITYLALGLVALVRDHELERFEVETGTASNVPDQSDWFEGIKPSLDPVAKRSHALKYLQRKSVPMLVDQTNSELQARPHYAKCRPSSYDASHEHSIPETSRSQEQDCQSRESSLWDSSVAEISFRASSTIEPSTGASNSLVTPHSARSSAVVSIASSMLPTYSDGELALHSQRHSHESVSLPEHVYLR